MDKKNTMLLTVIAVATLLVAVVGATFAFFSVTSTTETGAQAGVNTQTQDVGVVALTDGEEDFYLYVTAAQMANTAAAKTTYYGNTTGIATAATTTNPGATTIATAHVTGGDTDVKYQCTFNYTITTTGVDTNDTNALAELVKAGKITVSANPTGNADNYVTSALVGTHALGTDVTNGTGTVNLKGDGAQVELQAYVSLENLDADQTALAGAQFTTEVEVTGFACDTIA